MMANLNESINSLVKRARRRTSVRLNVPKDHVALKFTVTDPVKVEGSIKYTVRGEDSQGLFECLRRYNEFYALRNALLQRWPGCYVPCIPEKSTF